jgi:CheY-like chemotaxis protein
VSDPVLLVDDDAATRKVARANLGLEGFDVLPAASGAEALARPTAPTRSRSSPTSACPTWTGSR